MILSAIILAGGKGERLRPLTNHKPKVMVEVAGKPILVWQMEWLKSHGIKNFVLTVSYKYEVIQNYLGDGKSFGVNISYSIEDRPLGRGGAIKQAIKDPLIAKDENYVVTNGDIITKMNLAKMINDHDINKALVTLLLVPYISRWGVVKIDLQNHISGFEEKPTLPYWINGGIYVFNHKIEALLPSTGDHEKETFPKIPKEKFMGYKDTGFWRAVDVVKDRSEAEVYLTTGQKKFS
jgi:NDP-sugar pyrophosphorylase family protein